MKKVRKVLCLMLAFALVLGVATASVAATVTKKQLTAEYSGIQITLDGQKIEPKDANGTTVEPFIVDGTTYLPVRALSNALGLDVSWDQATQTVILKSKQQQTAPTPTGKFDATTVANQLEITAYNWDSPNRFSEREYLALEIKNTSQFTIGISARATFYDAANSKIGTASDSESCVPAGHTVLIVMSNDKSFARCEYAVSVSEANLKYYTPTAQNITVESNKTENKLVVSAKNNGAAAAEFAKVTALFFKDGQPVDYSYTYCVDDDYELKPGAMIDSEMSTYGVEYDSYKLFVSCS